MYRLLRQKYQSQFLRGSQLDWGRTTPRPKSSGVGAISLAKSRVWINTRWIPSSPPSLVPWMKGCLKSDLGWEQYYGSNVSTVGMHPKWLSVSLRAEAYHSPSCYFHLVPHWCPSKPTFALIKDSHIWGIKIISLQNDSAIDLEPCWCPTMNFTRDNRKLDLCSHHQHHHIHPRQSLYRQ
jgi:hypothetical protein